MPPTKSSQSQQEYIWDCSLLKIVFQMKQATFH